MAVISKIRSYSGLLIAVIGFALAAFVLGDFLGYGPMGGQRLDIGKIDKTSISYQEFEQRVSEQTDNWRQQTGQANLGPREAFQLREQVWNQMQREILLGQELERLGIEISSDELFDMVHGPQPHNLIRQSFTDPQTGTYDPQQVVEFLRNFDMLDPSVQNQWVTLEQFMKQERAENKYHNLIRRAYYVPGLIAERDYNDRNAAADIRFVYAPYNDISDTLVTVSDRELRRYYDENKESFHREASRSIEYVSFNVFPTDQDREALRSELEELREELEEVEDIAPFINSVSDRRFDPTYYGQGELTPEIDMVLFDAPVGSVHGPYVDGNSYVLAKLVDAQVRPDSMRASHILVAYAGSQAPTPATRSIAQARERADSLAAVVRSNPARFGEVAMEASDDPSAQLNMGDLEWFRDGAMVPSFNEAVINASTGSIITAESEFGIHVIHVTGKSAGERKIQVAMLTRDIQASSRTYQDVYAQASLFASQLRESKEFHQTAEELDVAIRTADNIREMDFTIPGVENPRGIIQWAFMDDTREGGFSRIFELDNRFIIATVTDITEEGIPSPDQIRDEVMAQAIQQKKFDMMADRITQAGTTLADIAGELEREIQEAADIRFTTNNLPGVGAEPRVIGAAFALEEGTVSHPIKGQNGIFVVELARKQAAIVPEDLSATKRQLQTTVANRVPNDVLQAIKNNARIEDNRSMFY
jgi:peptidyl-prolyl cis-trans isomerase D